MRFNAGRRRALPLTLCEVPEGLACADGRKVQLRGTADTAKRVSAPPARRGPARSAEASRFGLRTKARPHMVHLRQIDQGGRRMDQPDRLAGFHLTISEQLNARLAESPRFFWALVAVSTGYGYVLWNLRLQSEPDRTFLFTLASSLAYFAVLWASWYLAALGYAFRFLQNSQHCMEHALQWDNLGPRPIPRQPGEPPSPIKGPGGPVLAAARNLPCPRFWPYRVPRDRHHGNLLALRAASRGLLGGFGLFDSARGRTRVHRLRKRPLRPQVSGKVAKPGDGQDSTIVFRRVAVGQVYQRAQNAR
jgi:hypothetical protein